MRTIQEVGLEIMNQTPKSFYVFCGVEYGIKLRYIEMLLKLYPNKVEYSSVDAALKFFETKHFIAPEPSVYIVRYDQDFIKNLDASTANRISNCKVSGCIVCIYQDDKSTSKLDKYLPDYSVSIDSVSTNFMFKYLHTDFPTCPDRFINIAIDISSDYFQASSICRAMQCVPVEQLYAFSDKQLKSLFGGLHTSDEQSLKIGVASRNFAHTISLVNDYEGDPNTLIYLILSTMIELEKIQVVPSTQSYLSPYAKRWSRADIYNMFMQCYDCLFKARSINADIFNLVIYLLSLSQFSEVPAVEDMV